LSTHLEKWLWFFNELSQLDEIPESFKGDIIKDAFSLSKLANMKPQKRKEYELSLKYYRDWVNTLDTAEAKGREEGKEEGIEQGIEQGIKQGIEQNHLKMINRERQLFNRMISKRFGENTATLALKLLNQFDENNLDKLGDIFIDSNNSQALLENMQRLINKKLH
jgi:flagellar biosynthesis/type III secretory pathway protein FliH